MTVRHGMDSARVREIASQLGIEVKRLGEIVDKGTASAETLSAHWGGDDGQELLVRWRTEAAGQILAATATLREASTKLRVQAEDQDEASGEGGGGGSGGGHGPGGGNGSGDGQGPRGKGSEGKEPGDSGEYDVTGRDPDSVGVLTNTDSEGNKHHRDPLTGKWWQEAEDGSWKRSQDITGHDTETSVDKTEGDNGWETSREKTHGTGGGREEWGKSWSKERSFDDNIGQDAKSVLDNVQSEPIVEKGLWDKQSHDSVASGEVGDEHNGASGEVLSYNAQTDGAMGIDATRGAYVEANAEAGAYLAKGEFHVANEYGTSGHGEGFIGAEVEANSGAQIGPGGVQVEAGAGGFAGGKIEGGVSQDLGPANVGASGSLSYGIGVHADVGAEISPDKVGVSMDVGATLGLGGSIKFDVSVSPNEIVGGLEDAGKALADSPVNPGNWW